MQGYMQTRMPLNDVCMTGSSGESDGRRRRLSFSMACCSSRERALKVRRRYRRTEGRERRKGWRVAALTMNLWLRWTPARGGARCRREPTGRRGFGAARGRAFGCVRIASQRLCILGTH